MNKKFMKPVSVIMMLICLLMTLVGINSNENAFTIVWGVATVLWMYNIQLWWSKSN